MTAVARRAAGFTLIEVLLATVLLAAGLALAFATVRAAMAVSQRGEALATRNERIRAVEGFLRRHLAAAQPLAMQVDPATGQPQRFVGEPQRMRFVADLPPYLGHGGPYVHALEVDGEAPRQRLRLALALLPPGAAQARAPVPDGTPDLLADGLAQVAFRYRGVDPATGVLGAWRDHWDDARRLPLQVSVAVTAADGGPWPGLVVNLPQGGNSQVRP